MESAAPASAVKWPNVPACYGWLSLDRRGGWRLKGEIVRHAGLISFINRHYGADGMGNWVFRNGPQLVFVDLEYTPLVFRFDSKACLLAHTGQAVGEPVSVLFDEEGCALVESALGLGLIDDRDLSAFLQECEDHEGSRANDALVDSALIGEARLYWRGKPIRQIQRDGVAGRFGFNPAPRA